MLFTVTSFIKEIQDLDPGISTQSTNPNLRKGLTKEEKLHVLVIFINLPRMIIKNTCNCNIMLPNFQRKIKEIHFIWERSWPYTMCKIVLNP